MAGPSAYVHSNADHVSNWSVNIDLINNMQTANGGELYIESTLRKLESIYEQLDAAAENFLQGYSTDSCQFIAQNAGDLLADLATKVIYGENGGSLVNALRRNNTIQATQIRDYLGDQITSLQEQILSQLRDGISVSEAASVIAKCMTGTTKITVTEAGSVITALGGMFDVQQFESSIRGTVVPLVTNQIFKTSKDLVTNKNGVYRKAIRDLIKSSQNFTNTQSLASSVQSFCDKLQNDMLAIAPNEIPFLIGTESLESLIKNFIKKLRPALEKDLANVSKSGKLFDSSNVGGIIGEEVRSTIRKTADSVIISFVVGDIAEDDKKAIDSINKVLKTNGAKEKIKPMISYRDDSKQSLSDLILLNTKTGRIARAQSKNHFVSYFLSGDKTNDKNQIENFRWRINNNVNLLYFLSGLSKTELGINLSTADLSTINYAMVNNVWFSYHQSAFPSHGEIGFDNVSVPDFETELEGSLEKLLASQITSLLGVSVATSINPTIIQGASNIFYLLNGRLKKTSDLIQQVINQLKDYNNLKLSQDKNRMVIVNIDTKGAGSISPGTKSDSMLVKKLRSRWGEEVGPGAGATSIGEEYGQKILEGIKITVSLGTSIDTLTKTSLVL